MSETFAGRYRLEQQLGAGSMAEVWLATDTQLGRRVALKLLRADADPVRFEREAHAVASLSHPNICRLYDYGSEGGRPFMVFEHLAGGTLDERLGEGGPLPDDETAAIAAAAAAGLAYAHEHGLVHRDLKPANILFDEEGRAEISDFGIARVSGVDTLTEAGTLIGTAAYMSPEQAAGQGATPASDVYSFGVILYRMLTGRLPFEASNAVDLLRRQQYETAPAIHSIRPDAPMRLAAVAEESLAKSPADRPPDGRTLAGLLAGTIVPVGADAATQIIPQPRKRRPWLIPALIGVPLAIVAGIALALILSDNGSNTPAPASIPGTTTIAPPPPAPPPPPAQPPPPPPPPPPPQPPPPAPPPAPPPPPPPLPPPPPPPLPPPPPPLPPPPPAQPPPPQPPPPP